MKLDQLLLTEDQLNEIKLSQVIASALLGGAATLMAPGTPPYKSQEIVNARQADARSKLALTGKIVDKHQIQKDLANQIVTLAHKYERKDFPRAKDILSIIDIESEFRPQAKSQLSSDPAVGLMQVRPGIWKIDPKELDDIEQQIKYGSQILHDYYQKLGNIEKTIQAYNVGITALRQGTENPRYLGKYKAAMRRYTNDPENVY